MSAAMAAIRSLAGTAPRRTALSSGSGGRMSFAELAQDLDRREAAFRASGARVLALAADNSPHWVRTDLAARAAGLAVVPIPHFFSPSQKLHALADSGADLLIAREQEVRALMLDFAPAGNAGLGSIEYPVWQRTSSSDGPAVPAGIGKISYTSGTTGRPRGVCIGHAASEAVIASLVAATESLGVSRHLCLLPLPTLLENVAGVDAPLAAGAEVVVPSLQEVGWCGAGGLDFRRLAQLISRIGPHSMILLPEMLRGLLAAASAGWTPPASLRFVAVGGGRVAPALIAQAEEAGLPVFEGYGLTECTSVVALNTPGSSRRGSVGKPLPHVALRIAANGEIRVSGPSVNGYLGTDRAAAPEFATGDLGFFDDDGFLYVHGRCRNVFINSYGRNVSPDWVEPEFLRHPHIRQIAIFGESRPWNVAVVVPAPAAAANEIAAAIAATNEGLPDYACVGSWIEADEPFSTTNGLLTANGRVRRAAVLSAYRHRIDACYRERIDRAAGDSVNRRTAV